MAEHDGVAIMACLTPSDADRLAVDGGEPADQLHVTLAYLAQPAADYSDGFHNDLVQGLNLAASQLPTVVEPFGMAVFNPDSDERDPCAVVLVQSQELADLHEAVLEVVGDELSTTFPIWIPHIAIAYQSGVDAIPEGACSEPIVLDRIVLAWGDQQMVITPADGAREAFLRGYARTTTHHGVGVTERARHALQAAVRVAEASPAPSGAPTLKLGELEGIWAVIYARREAIEHLHGRAFADVMKAIAAIDWQQIVDSIGTQLLIDPGITGKQLADELGTRIRNLIAAELPASERAAWNQAMIAALTDATAEGQAAALALIADTASITIDWELAAREAKAALTGGQVLADDAAAWVTKQTQGLGYEIAQKLAALWDSGASRQDMLDAIQAILGADTTVAGYLLDTAIGQALTLGALTTYGMAGVTYVDFITAGDERVCYQCETAEIGNPYLLGDLNAPPLHPRCRCAVSPSDFQFTSAAAALVDAYSLDVEAA